MNTHTEGSSQTGLALGGNPEYCCTLEAQDTKRQLRSLKVNEQQSEHNQVYDCRSKGLCPFLEAVLVLAQAQAKF